MQQNQNNKFLAILTWLLPSGSELAIILALSFITLGVSNASFFKDVIFLPGNFSLTSIALGSLNGLLVRLVGVEIARSVVVAIFWAMIGLLVYLLIWLGLNFSNELDNDLATTKYMHPKNVDTRSPLRNFISRVSFQFVAFVVFVFYINLMVGALMPLIGGLFRQTIHLWFSGKSLEYAAFGIIAQLAVLHFFVLLVRSILLRKRLFG